MATIRGVKTFLSHNATKCLDYKSAKAKQITCVNKLYCIRRSTTRSTGDEEKRFDQNANEQVKSEPFDSCRKLLLEEAELQSYPINRFDGSIHIVKGPSHEHDLGIKNAINRLKKKSVLGLDVEMAESIQLFPLNKHTKKIKVVQIASETDAMLWQLRNFPGLPSSLEYFLKSDILKVGHAISEDVVQLKNEFNITSQLIFDTLPWAIELNCKPLTLHALCAIFLGWRISKGLQTSNWDRRELSMNQVHYACTDAWASLMLYKEMKSYAERNCYLFPLPIESVDNILDTRLDTKRKRRRRHVKNYKARRNYELMINNSTFITE